MVVVVIVVVVVVVGSSGSGSGSSNTIYNAKKNSIIKKIIRTTAATGLSWNIIQFKRVIAE